jgi:hypothetical protein
LVVECCKMHRKHVGQANALASPEGGSYEIGKWS